MNPQIPHSMISDRVTELRQQAAQTGTGAKRDRDHGHAPRLRRRIGLAMIDAGSRMLATTQPVTTE